MSQEPIVSNTLQRQEVEVLRVIDGDTISFLYNGNITSARLI